MLINAFCDSVELAAMALAFWYGGQLLASREYEPTQFFVIYVAIIMGSIAAGQFFSAAPSIAVATASANRILGLRVFNTTKKHDSNSTVPKDNKSGAHVSLERVNFKYATRDDPAFRNLSLDIPAGSFAAFVGPSGCGKTSIISLLERFYDPTAGRILINDIDIKTMPLEGYRQSLSLVAQEPKLFSGTIRENLVLGLGEPENLKEEQIHQACRDAEIHDFVISLPEGYQTSLGSSTSTALSGGQKQRLCLARALLRSPKLLLLDEATSSLDSQSEKLVQAAIERLAGQRSMTVIAVAHRLATIQKADVIFVFGEGEVGNGARILEKGTHSELMRMRGAYWQMCQAQALDR
jgi:ABC-type multidrug transport system fused ATPase/permease subunit